jgi:Tfp pilus assembly protein PilN
MRAVNLLPRDEQRPRLEGGRIPLIAAAGGVAAVTAGAVLLAFAASGTADERRAELAAVEAAIARLPKAPDQAVSQGTLVQERTDRVAALSTALSTRFAFDRLFREISYVIPKDAWLTGLKAATPASLTPAPGSTGGAPAASSPGAEAVTIEGATYSHESVARILSRLSVVPSLEGVRLTATARVEPQPTTGTSPSESTKSKKSKKSKKAKQVKKRAVVTFTISASLRPEGS